MINYYKNELETKQEQLKIAKAGAIQHAKKYCTAAANISNRGKDLSWEDVCEVANELNKVISAVNGLEESVKYSEKSYREEVEKAEHQKAVEAAKELLIKEGIL